MEHDKAIAAIDANPRDFRPDFRHWIADNFHLYKEFERRARVVGSRRPHYSARTIMEVIRHDTAIGQLDGRFKVNNNYTPDCARLFAHLNPGYSTLFEYRDHKAAA